jgi:hypothetical protein
MRLSANIVINWANVNQFDYEKEEQWKIRAGDPNRLYFQMIDLDQKGIRYMMGVGASNQPFQIVVTCPSIDNSKVLQFIAQQADPNDLSIFFIEIAPTQIPSSGNVMFTVTEGLQVRNFRLHNAMHTELPGADGSC